MERTQTIQAEKNESSGYSCLLGDPRMHFALLYVFLKVALPIAASSPLVISVLTDLLFVECADLPMPLLFLELDDLFDPSMGATSRASLGGWDARTGDMIAREFDPISASTEPFVVIFPL